jgi:hypothetical protein
MAAAWLLEDVALAVARQTTSFRRRATDRLQNTVTGLA